MKVAVLLARGFEEIEALSVVDVMRRAGIECKMVVVEETRGAGGETGVVVGDEKGDDEACVTGAHEIEVKADVRMSEVVRDDYDMVVLPGGLPGADILKENGAVIEWVQEFAQNDAKYVAAICAAPQVLAKAGVVTERRATSYPAETYRWALAKMGAKYVEDERVVMDGNMITSQGPGTSLEFAYKLVEILGGDAEGLKTGMLYQ